MKLVSFVAAGKPGFGAVVAAGGIADLSGPWPSLRAALPDVSNGKVAAAIEGAPILAMASVQLTIPVPDADKVICAGLNFRAHVQETGQAGNAAHPSIFLRSLGTFVGHRQPLLKPAWTETFDYEAELAVVIGKPGRYIKLERAMEHIAGYTLLMDGSIRNVQFEHSLTAGKNFFRSGAIGPWIVTADEVADPTKLELIGRANGEQRQRASISDLIFDIPSLISYASRMNELLAGDIISVGTPSGVGATMNPTGYLKEGDVFETEVPGIGVLSNPVAVDPLSIS